MRIAICEDKEEQARILMAHIERYQKERDFAIEYKHFPNGLAFLDNYKIGFDVVFMDIEMPVMNGMEAAKRLRGTDPYVPLVFITDLKQYALKGYEVEALDFLVKPIAYPAFATMMDRVRKNLVRRGDDAVALQTAEGTVKVALDDISYIEMVNHYVVYHTTGGEIRFWGSLAEEEKRLPPERFVRSSSAYLVNLSAVTKVAGADVFVEGACLPLSRSKKAAFTTALFAYMRGGK